MSAKHDRALILVPDSGWGDAVHALASAMVMCAAFDRRCLVFMPDEPAAHFKTLDNMTSPEAVAGQSYDWWCLNSQVTLQTRAGQRYGVTSDQLDEHMPLWPTVKLAMAERGAASKFHRPEEYWEQHGKEIVIASSDPMHSCVELHTGWADKDSGTFDMCHFSESPCKFSVLVGGNYHPSPATHALAIPLDMSTFEVRRCAMRFALQLQPQLVEQADERLALARSGRAPSAGCCTSDPECGACPEKADWCGQSRENCLVCVKAARKQNASLYHNKRWCRLGAINPSSSHRRGGRPISGAVDLSDGAAATPSTKVELNRLKRARREAELNEDGDEIERFTELIKAVWAELSPQTKLKWLKAKRRDAELDEDGAEVERFTELIEAIEAAKAPEPLRDDVSAVLIGIHIRAGRFYKGLHPDYTCKDDDVFADGESSNSTCYMEPEEFDPYADAARDLEQQYSDKYGAGHTFLWIVFTDSNALLPSLLERWDRAVPLKMGESSHSGCDAEGTSRVEWLMLSKCDMLVVSKSGFSMTAASYAEPMVPTLIVQSADNASSLTYMDEGNWNSWLGTAVGT